MSQGIGQSSTSSYAATDPLAGLHSQPIISNGGADSTFAGRVIIELWQKAGRADASGLAYVVEAIDGNHASLLNRVATALPLRLADNSPTGA